MEAKGFRDRIDDFSSLDTVIIGVSKDSVKCHANFKAKYSLPFYLVSDENAEILKKYYVWVEKSMFGKKYMGIERTTFLIDKKGKIVKIWQNVKWRELLITVNDSDGLNEVNVIEKIKEILKAEHQDVYEEWENNQFDVNYLFYVVYDNDLRSERVEKYTLLHLATRNNLENLLDALLKAKGAAISNSEKIIGILLKSGKMNVNAQSCGGYTALHIAICYQSWKAMDVLLKEKEIKSNTEDKDGRTPLHSAISGNCDRAVLKKLIKAGAGIDAKNNDGQTPLHLAAKNCNIDTIEALIDEGANINEKDNNGQTPLHLAILHCFCYSTVKTLVKKGADIDAKNNDGQTPLHLAARGGKIDTVLTLINKGANINKKDNNGQTPSHLAAKHNKTCTMKILINKGANIHVEDNNSHTPLWHANGNVKGILIASNNKQEDKKVVLKTAALSALVVAMASAVGHAAYGISIPNVQMQDPILEKNSNSPRYYGENFKEATQEHQQSSQTL
ncbi:uncharacterized protein LOC112689477 [Sipha flava]|uniref:Uncharacterized protein LOC112689477 n=1 Tax=Sipha flava TaxID=143950 RepID=A0A8B8G818_9HEMI|nr:uncharacterized protein LOC112689477 [Sipha flava]